MLGPWPRWYIDLWGSQCTAQQQNEGLSWMGKASREPWDDQAKKLLKIELPPEFQNLYLSPDIALELMRNSIPSHLNTIPILC